MKGRHLILKEVTGALKRIFVEGRYASHVVPLVLKSQRKWGARDRRFFSETVYDLVRWWGLYTGALSLTTEQVMSSPEAMDQVIKLYEDEPPEKLSSRLQQKGAPFGVWASYPKDLLEDFDKELGEETSRNYLQLMNRPAEVFLRVNTLRSSAEEVQAALQDVGIATELLGPFTLALKERKNIFSTAPFRKGWVEVQDVSSQQVAPLLNPQPGEFVIDGCAGAGGKTLHLAALMENKGRLLALDVHEKKLLQLKQRARRAGVSNLNVQMVSSTKVIKRQLESADALLLDVPCSGSGVIKRHPDTKWKWREQATREVEELQRSLLQRYSQMVRPGGRIVYATCSVLPRENQNQVRWFLSENTQWSLKEERTFAPEPGDGFYAALLERSSF